MRSLFLCPVIVASAGAHLAEGAGGGAATPASLAPGAATLRDYRASAPRLYAALAQGREGNFVMSPRALHTGLGMVYAGADASSRAAMARALHWSSSPESLVAGHREATAALLSSLARAGDAALHEAARLWVSPGYPVAHGYEQTLMDGYHMGTAPLDFSHADTAAHTINTWVKEQTAGMVGHLVEPRILMPDTRLVQTSTLHVKAGWAGGELSREGTPRTFTSLHGDVQKVHMMRNEAGLAHEDAGLVVASVDYERDRQGGGLAMTFLLPKGALEDAEARLSTDGLTHLPGLQSLRAVELIFPEFTLATGGDITAALHSLGIERIVLDRMAQEPQELTAVVQQSRIKVDEKGTEGAAAVAVVMAPKGGAAQRRKVVVDRPFLFVMHDKASGEILFMGRVTHL